MKAFVLAVVMGLVLGGQETCRAVTAAVEAWSRQYNSSAVNARDNTQFSVWDSHGDAFSVGTTGRNSGQDGLLVLKYRGSDGRLLWEAHTDTVYGQSYRPIGAVVDSENHLLVAGSYLDTSGEPRVQHIFVMKFAGPDGTRLWEGKSVNSGMPWESTNGLVLDREGNVIVEGYAGSSLPYRTRQHTMKFSGVDGRMLWEHWSPEAREIYSAAIRGVAVDSQGQVVIGGAVGAYEDGNGPDLYLAKLSGDDGTILWERRINGPAHGYRVFGGVAVDVNDDPVVIGQSPSISGIGDKGYLAKFSGQDGQLLWEHRYSGPGTGFHTTFDLIPDARGDIVVAGNAFTDPNQASPYAYYTAKYSGLDGTLLWDDLFTGNANTSMALAVGSDGDVVVAGRVYILFSTVDFLLLNYSGATGQRNWQYDVVLSDGLPPGLAIGPQGDVLVSYPGDAHVQAFSGFTGARLWDQRYDGPADGADVPVAVAFTPEGDVVVTGSSYDGQDRDIYTAKYSVTTGSLVWEDRYDGPKHLNEEPAAMVVNAAGDLFVVGTSEDQCYAAKWSGSDGHMLWETRLIDPGAQWLMGHSLFLDPTGNLIICGDQVSSRLRGILIAKLSPENGQVIWRKVDYGPGNAGTSYGGITIDFEGNVLVAGSAKNPGKPGEAYTAKYAGVDGRVVWRSSFSMEDGGFSAVEGAIWNFGTLDCIAVDNNGDAFVSGRLGDGQRVNHLTIKYRAADGSRLWHRLHENQDGGDEGGQHIQVTDSGDAIVLGYSRIPPERVSILLLRYGAHDGGTLWEKVLDSGEFGNNATQMKLDGKGNLLFTSTGSSWIDYFLFTASYSLDTGELNWRTTPKKGLYRGSLATDGKGAMAVLSEGDMTVGGPDFVTLLYREVEMPRLSIRRVGADWRLLVEGRRQQSATVLRSVDLKNWEPIGSVTGGEDGRGEFVDASPPPKAAYYRILVP